MVRRLWVRLVCKVRGHDPLTIIDKAEWTSIGTIPGMAGLSLQGRIVQQHKVCRRCEAAL